MAGPAATQPPLPDELLEDIFLHLEEPGDLVRTSAACKSFRRTVTARRFLRRLRSLRSPPVLGILAEPLNDGILEFRPAEPPHRSAPAARAVDITFSFLPTPALWMIEDARDARVLLSRRSSSTPTFKDVLVCDPLHRRYVQLPPIPDDLTASVAGWDALALDTLEYFFDPSSKHEEEQDVMPFRVICAVHGQLQLGIFHFSSVTGKWLSFTFNRAAPLNRDPIFLARHYARGCFYWTHAASPFVLDMREMKLSVSDLACPRYDQKKGLTVVEAGEGKLGLFSIDRGMLQLHTKTLGNNGDGKNWQHDKTIPFPEMDLHWEILHTTEGHVFVDATPRGISQDNDCTSSYGKFGLYFTLDTRTLRFERVCESGDEDGITYVYANFPPPLSLPSI